MLPAAVARTTKGIVGGVLPHVTAGILPDWIVDESVAPSVILSNVEDATQCVTDVIERLRPLLVEGTETDRDIGQLVADLQGCLDDIRAIRDDLDSFRAADSLSFDDAESLIQTWQWERDLRAELVTTQGRILDAQTVARELVDGVSEKVVVARSGETWQSIAADQLGDWQEWPRLVEANGGDASGLIPGTVLVIPRKR